MNKVIATLILCLLTKFAIASDFVGKWQVYKVDMPETYYGEIKYPKYFEITENEGEVSGYYKDQFDFESQFSLRNCQMFSTGLSSGDFDGRSIMVMLSGVFRSLARCQPA